MEFDLFKCHSSFPVETKIFCFRFFNLIGDRRSKLSFRKTENRVNWSVNVPNRILLLAFSFIRRHNSDDLMIVNGLVRVVKSNLFLMK